MIPRLLLLTLLGSLLAPLAAAQDGLQSPEAFLGYPLGSRFTPHHRVVDYVHHVAENSPNVILEQYGETYEGRPLLTAFVTTPANLARLDDIRTNNLRLAGLAEGDADGPATALVWLSYNVHGNESVSTEASMATLYDLANPANARTQAWLANTVVVLDPCINPDGRDRYVHWYNRTVGRFPNPDPDAREHHEPWPGGRTNHYWFDLNRDWAWMTQQETQYRIPHYSKWMPHVHVDFHEQGVNAPYFFAPAAEPFHEDITPWQRSFQTTIGQNHARYFDAEGWLYFTRQVFDLFYPGYGDTWPTYNGAIGMTYEQGGSSRAGLGILTAEGDTLTLRDRIDHHHTTGLSTVEATANNHEQVVTAFRDYYARARTNPPGTYKTYVVKGDNSPGRLAALAEHLDRQGIAYGYAGRARSERGFHYGDGATGSVAVQPGDLIISAYQPKAVLAKVLFEPVSALVDSLTYDITAWSLPYAYGLDAYALTERIDPEPDAPARPAATVTGPAQPYAYLARWNSLADARFLADVLRQGVKLRYAEQAFEADGRTYDPGTLILTRIGNEALGSRFDTVIRAAAAAHDIPLHGVASGLVTQGSDFGSGNVPFLKRPEVAVLVGAPLSSSAAGEVWHFFDRQIGYPTTLIDPDDLGSVRLSDYDVLILPSGSYGSILTETRLNDVKAWVRGGGRLIALEGAAGFLAGKSGFALKQKTARTEDEDGNNTAEAPVQRRYGERRRQAVTDDVPGAIFRVALDNTHPLGFGFGTVYHTLKRGSTGYAPLSGNNNWNVGLLGTHLSGFAGYKARTQLEQTLVFGVQQMGRGQVVYMLDNPLFRGFWYSGHLLFSNAVFF